MNTSSQSRIAVVTAAGGGIGRAITLRLCQNNDTVFAIDRSHEALAALGEGVTPLVADMTDPAAVERVFAEIGARGALHVLVNGVGSTCSSALGDLSLARWRELFDLNLTSAFLATRAALPLLQRTSGDRAIINLSSTLASIADPTTMAYGAFKAALEQMTRSLALELAPHRIRVLAVAPGPVEATGGEAAFEDDRFRRLNPLGRFASPDEIGALVAFLASPEASYVTGVTLRIDGGDSALGAGWGPLLTLAES